MPRVYVSIGSNVDKERNIPSAVAALRDRFGALACSGVYETEAVGFEGGNFYNLVVSFDTGQSLEELAHTLRRIEDDHGRVRGGARFSSRTLDLDILLYGTVVRHDERFDVPRDEIPRYAFVLLPLVEIAAAVVHPETGERLADMAARLDLDAQNLRKVALDIDACEEPSSRQ
jgi:2-amino-4-hydroxy-6-hydroxymethyldihydropteridine diphosphokinase